MTWCTFDPPFNSKANYAAPIGSEAAGAEFKDTWTLQDVDVAWLDLIEAKHKRLNRVIHAAMTDSDKSYLIYMAVRLLEMQRLLKPSGSIYLHCDPTMSHYLKLLMDAIFGPRNFRNEITWKRTTSRNDARRWGRVHDTILFYSRSGGFQWNRVSTPYDPTYVKRFYRHEDKRGKWMSDVIERSQTMGERPNLSYEFNGYTPDWGWRVRREKLEALAAEDRIAWSRNGRPRLKRYLHEQAGPPILDVITDIPLIAPHAHERTGYPTQKPLALLDRIIQASSERGGVVLDPFCGCATALIAAEKQGRQWVGIDIAPKAAELVRLRLKNEVGLFYQGAHRVDVPSRTDIEPLRRYNHPENRRALYGEQGGYCNGCAEHFRPQNLTVDHIIPRSKGGTDHLSNLQLLCGHCNSVKGDRGQEYLRAKLAA